MLWISTSPWTSKAVATTSKWVMTKHYLIHDKTLSWRKIISYFESGTITLNTNSALDVITPLDSLRFEKGTCHPPLPPLPRGTGVTSEDVGWKNRTRGQIVELTWQSHLLQSFGFDASSFMLMLHKCVKKGANWQHLMKQSRSRFPGKLAIFNQPWVARLRQYTGASSSQTKPSPAQA